MIEASGLVLRHGDREILRGIDLTVNTGEVAAIIGPSGGGKSTFLRCLNGLERFQEGRVTVGREVLEPTLRPSAREAVLERIRCQLGMVFQAFHLFAHRTAIENVMEAPLHVLRRPREEVRTEARALLERVGLADRLDAYPHQLSGGQQQRVAIARALAMRPRAILFDEPTSALDPTMTAEVLEVITDLAREGMTMIVVTHAMAFARQVATTVHVFGGGRVVESGPPERIFTDPQAPESRELLAAERAS